jgi:hypothetical protein
MIVIQQQLQRGKLYCDYLPLQTCKQVMIVIQQQLQRGNNLFNLNQNENFQHFFFIKTALYSATVLTATAIFIEAINVYTLTKDKYEENLTSIL